jgi:putative transposase
MLVSQSKNIALSALMKELKKSSSAWIQAAGRRLRDFQWQDGYGAFSIGQRDMPELKRYIAKPERTPSETDIPEGVDSISRGVWNRIG